MKFSLKIMISAILVLFLLISSIVTYTYLTKDTFKKEILYEDEFQYEDIKISWMNKGGFKFTTSNEVIYIDPYNIAWSDDPFFEPADYLIITHIHAPHFSILDMNKVIDNDTVIIMASGAASLYPSEEYLVIPGDILSFETVEFEFVPAYNIDKVNDQGQLFHDPAALNIGVIIDTGKSRIYHATDTDRIPEMKGIKTDIAILPVSGYAWMTAEEAVKAVEDIKQSSNLKYAIPTHYGNGNGGIWDAESFSEQVECSVVILEKLY
ncbi:MAG: MBL fold metallo-hydrolase [Candidatus Kariarchaeaceae archaeon]|jgi:L-ascorbate metabolism protein UlaG (beta-lactamase superfamily)